MKDDVFIRGKVPMTKEPIRAISIDYLQAKEAKRILDIGAGTGSVSVQLAYDFPHLELVAIERNDEAISLIHANKEKFGLKNLQIIQALAPAYDQVSGTFDSIFIGGSGGQMDKILDWSWQLLKPGGIIVLNFILLENALEAVNLLENGSWEEVEMVQVTSASWTKLGKGHYFKNANPTIIIRGVKGE